MDFYDEIYYSLIGELEEGAALPWVGNAFAPGSECEQAYARLLDGRNRVLDKLGAEDDPDLSQMLSHMLTIQRTLCRKVMALRRIQP